MKLTFGGEFDTQGDEETGAGAGTGSLSALHALFSSSDLSPSPDSGLFLEEDIISAKETKKSYPLTILHSDFSGAEILYDS